MVISRAGDQRRRWVRSVSWRIERRLPHEKLQHNARAITPETGACLKEED